MNVLVLDQIDELAINKLKENFETDVKTGLSEKQICEIIGDYKVVVVRSATKITKNIIDSAKKLKIIGRAGTGVDSIDIKYASEKKIAVMNTPTSNSISVAEFVMGLIITASRNIISSNNSLKDGKWTKKESKGFELKRKTLGIIGMGRIGQEVCKRALSFDMNIIGLDPIYTKEEISKMGATKLEMDQIMKEADYITLHVPLIEQTKGFINKERLSMMKKNAFLINCARGGLIDEETLFEKLQNKEIGGAALDVFETEPPLQSKLLTLNNIITTPHIAGSTYEAQIRCGLDIVEQFKKFFDGEYVNIVNLKQINLGEK